MIKIKISLTREDWEDVRDVLLKDFNLDNERAINAIEKKLDIEE